MGVAVRKKHIQTSPQIDSSSTVQYTLEIGTEQTLAASGCNAKHAGRGLGCVLIRWYGSINSSSGKSRVSRSRPVLSFWAARRFHDAPLPLDAPTGDDCLLFLDATLTLTGSLERRASQSSTGDSAKSAAKSTHLALATTIVGAAPLDSIR